MAKFGLADIVILNVATAILFLILIGCAIFLYTELKWGDLKCCLSSLKTLGFQNYSARLHPFGSAASPSSSLFGFEDWLRVV